MPASILLQQYPIVDYHRQTQSSSSLSGSTRCSIAEYGSNVGTLDGYVGNEHIIDKVKLYIESGDVPHLLFYGQAGTGKTTLAKIIAGNVDADIMYIACLQSSELVLMLFLTVISWETIKYILFKLK